MRTNEDFISPLSKKTYKCTFRHGDKVSKKQEQTGYKSEDIDKSGKKQTENSKTDYPPNKYTYRKTERH